MASFISIDEAKEIIMSRGLRPLEQRGFYSRFIRAIDDTKIFYSTTTDISKNGRVRKSALLKALDSMKRQAPLP